MARIKIAHISGPTATIQNTPPLVTSRKARARQLDVETEQEHDHGKFDALRPQDWRSPQSSTSSNSPLIRSKRSTHNSSRPQTAMWDRMVRSGRNHDRPMMCRCTESKFAPRMGFIHCLTWRLSEMAHHGITKAWAPWLIGSIPDRPTSRTDAALSKRLIVLHRLRWPDQPAF